MDLESANANHQNEIEQILRDASKKINKFKDQLETKKIELNAEAKLEKFKQKVRVEWWMRIVTRKRKRHALGQV